MARQQWDDWALWKWQRLQQLVGALLIAVPAGIFLYYLTQGSLPGDFNSDVPVGKNDHRDIERDALRAVFAARGAAPLPHDLDLSRLIEQRLRRRRVPWLAAASVVLALAVGGGAGWLLRPVPTPDPAAPAMAILQQQALATYAVYAVDKRHPIEVGADQKDHLSTWLSNRLRRVVAPPDLETLNYHLIGGRLLATEHGGAAALFIYEDSQGQRLGLVLRPMSPALHASTSDIREGIVNGCAWIANGMGYAVVAVLPDAELDRVAGFIQQAS